MPTLPDQGFDSPDRPTAAPTQVSIVSVYWRPWIGLPRRPCSKRKLDRQLAEDESVVAGKQVEDLQLRSPIPEADRALPHYKSLRVTIKGK